MKLLFLFTGGTIGSTATGDTIATDAQKPSRLLTAYAERYPVDFAYDTLSPFSELSENFSGEHIARLLIILREHLDDGYDGIIVTHGTDTLAYTAAALGYALGNDSLPVCLVSSNFPIEDARANGIDNLFAAISLIRQGTSRGVFVPYQNGSDAYITIHRAARLSTSLAHMDEVFSVANTPYGEITRDGILLPNPAYREEKDALPPPSTALCARSLSILRVFPYPGMRYPALFDGVRAILLDTFHSGTVDGRSEEAHAFFRAAKERGIPLFVTGNAKYESAQIFDEYGVTRLPLSPIAAYMKLWLYGPTSDLTLSRGGDIF